MRGLSQYVKNNVNNDIERSTICQFRLFKEKLAPETSCK